MYNLFKIVLPSKILEPAGTGKCNLFTKAICLKKPLIFLNLQSPEPCPARPQASPQHPDFRQSCQMSKGRKTGFSKTGFLTKRIDTSWEDLRRVETTRSQKTHRDDLRRFETIWDDSIVSNRLKTSQIVSMVFSSGLVSSQILSTRIDTFC